MAPIRILVLFSAVFLSSSAFAYYVPVCGYQTHSEGYFFGVRSGYTGSDERPRLNDELCFQLGKKDGSALATAHIDDHDSCDTAFDDGKDQGLLADILVITDPSDCSNAGYGYGRALLSSSARDGRSDVVGQSCRDAYQTGYSDGQSHTLTGSYSTNQDAACYQAGVEDGTSGIR